MKKGTAGFTLVEMLVALAIFTVVALSLNAAFRGGVQAWARGNEERDLQQQARAVLETLGRELRNALPAPGDSFVGKSEELTFYTVRDRFAGSPDEPPPREIFKVSYKAQPMTEGSSEGEITVQRTQRLVSSSSPESGEKSLPLLSSPATLRFEYADPASLVTGAVRWKSPWDKPGMLPPAVRVSLVLRENGEEIPFVKTIPLPTVE